MRSDHLSKHLKTHLTKKNLSSSELTAVDIDDDMGPDSCELAMSVDMEQDIDLGMVNVKQDMN